jgi:hypothetical protein
MRIAPKEKRYIENSTFQDQFTSALPPEKDHKTKLDVNLGSQLGISQARKRQENMAKKELYRAISCW